MKNSLLTKIYVFFVPQDMIDGGSASLFDIGYDKNYSST
jgi:hypothetical protein